LEVRGEAGRGGVWKITDQDDPERDQREHDDPGGGRPGFGGACHERSPRYGDPHHEQRIGVVAPAGLVEDHDRALLHVIQVDEFRDDQKQRPNQHEGGEKADQAVARRQRRSTFEGRSERTRNTLVERSPGSFCGPRSPPARAHASATIPPARMGDL